MEKNFQTVLAVPKVWQALLSIESFDDLSAFLAQTQPLEARGPDGLTRAEWVRPIRRDHREVCFLEDQYRACLELLSGNERYYTVASIVLPGGERYARPDVAFQIRPVESLEIRGIGRFSWRQEIGQPERKLDHDGAGAAN